MTIAVALFVIGAICVAAEMFTGTLALLGIGISFIFTSIAHYFFENAWLSLFIFVVGVVVSILSTKAFRKNNHPEVASGVYALVGRTLKVIEVTGDNNKQGIVTVNGEYWTVESEGTLEVGNEVVVREVRGATLYVNK